MCLTRLQEIKGRLYFEDASYSNGVNSIILFDFVSSPEPKAQGELL